MSKQQLSGGVAHKLPEDLKKTLRTSAKAQAAWENITPLARNEFICWVEDAKQDKTRQQRIKKLLKRSCLRVSYAPVAGWFASTAKISP